MEKSNGEVYSGVPGTGFCISAFVTGIM